MTPLAMDDQKKTCRLTVRFISHAFELLTVFFWLHKRFPFSTLRVVAGLIDAVFHVWFEV